MSALAKLSAVNTGASTSGIAHCSPMELLETYWRSCGFEDTPVLDMSMAMARQFIGEVDLGPRECIRHLQGRGAMYLGNHQTAYETLFLCSYLRALMRVPIKALARSEVRDRWLHEFVGRIGGYPGVHLPEMVIYLDQNQPQQVFETFTSCRERLKRETLSIVVHVDGTRALCAGQRVTRLSSMLIDMAIAAKVPIVPFRLSGALPLTPVPSGLHVPFGYGAQDYYFGAPIEPSALAVMPYAHRREFLLRSINELGPPLAQEEPCKPDPVFGAEVQDWMDRTGATHEYAVLLSALRRLPNPCAETRQLLEAAAHGQLKLSDSPTELWLAAMATRLFGPSGPAVVVGSTR